MHSTPESVAVEDLTFSYPNGHAVLDQLSMTVKPGEKVALLGPNGAGKTTLALHLNGVLELQAGSIKVNGIPINEDNLSEIRRRVGMVFQNADDQLFMPTVREDVAFGPANLGLTKEQQAERVREALDAVDAIDFVDRTPHHLSGGEKRRVAIATVLAMHPDVLVLDEPTSGLDPFGRRELANLLKSLDLTQLVITHDLPLALELCPRSVIISNGRVVADGPTPEVLADSQLLAAHRLELPYGFSPAAIAQPEP